MKYLPTALPASHRLVALATALLVVPIGAATSAQEWSQWRGPSRNGVIELSAPAAWPEQLVRQWSVSVGRGISSPVVSGGRVFIFSRENDQEIVRALDLTTGKELWTDRYAADYAVRSEASALGKGPRATPIVANGRLYTFGVSGVLTSYDAGSGKVVWRKNTSDEFDRVAMRYGVGSSPLIDQGRLIVYVGHETSGALLAYDARTGMEQWRWTGDSPSYSSPVIAEFAGSRQVIALSYRSLVGVSVESGALLWQTPYTGLKYPHALTPVVYGQTVMVSNYGKGFTAFKLSQTGGMWTVETAWHNGDVSMSISTPVVHGDRVYGLADRNSGQFVCLDARTGQVSWASQGREGQTAAILRSSAQLLLMKDDGGLIVAKLTSEALEVVVRYQLANEAIWSTPAIAGRQLLVRHGDKATAWALPPASGAASRD